MRDLVASAGLHWQDGYIEHVIGRIRRERIDRVVILSKATPLSAEGWLVFLNVAVIGPASRVLTYRVAAHP